ncbi:MAG: (2Fe-2S)-binding protein [Alphaproteobacteria bacterium]|nr:(2Fe-2S)-binding protein [Alphaproteobacteria bacterium]
MSFTVKVNGVAKAVDVDADTPILWVLRDELNLTGTKYGCGVAACGSCTVHVDGEPQRSCQLTVADVEGSEITTIEGVDGPVAEAVRAAWREHDVVQCGYCQSGQIMQAIGLLTETPNPSDEDIDAYMDGNACRCATYHRIRVAIHAAATKVEG